MLLRHLFMYTVMILALLACGSDELQPGDVQVLSEKVAILPPSESPLALFPCSRNGHNGLPSESAPTTSEVLSAENRLKNYLRRRLDRPLEDYYRQYTAIMVGGKRVLVVHAFKTREPIENVSPEWRSKYLPVCDAGKDSWGVEHLVEHKRFVNFETSSEFPPR